MEDLIGYASPDPPAYTGAPMGGYKNKIDLVFLSVIRQAFRYVPNNNLKMVFPSFWNLSMASSQSETSK